MIDTGDTALNSLVEEAANHLGTKYGPNIAAEYLYGVERRLPNKVEVVEWSKQYLVEVLIMGLRNR